MKKGVSFVWDQACQDVFDEIKQYLVIWDQACQETFEEIKCYLVSPLVIAMPT